MFKVDLTKMTYKDKLKKRDASQQTVRAGKSAPDKSKMPKKAEGNESPSTMVVAVKAALNEARKDRNEAQE